MIKPEQSYTFDFSYYIGLVFQVIYSCNFLYSCLFLYRKRYFNYCVFLNNEYVMKGFRKSFRYIECSCQHTKQNKLNEHNVVHVFDFVLICYTVILLAKNRTIFKSSHNSTLYYYSTRNSLPASNFSSFSNKIQELLFLSEKCIITGTTFNDLVSVCRCLISADRSSSVTNPLSYDVTRD